MDTKTDAKRQVIIASQEYGIASVLFRNAIGRRLGLNITDIGCINFLFIRGSSTPTELARYTGLTSGSTTAMLDRLERANLITRKTNPNDRRGIVVEVQQRSREAIGPMVAGSQKAQAELLDGYTEKELAAIADFLTRFSENVNQQTRAIEAQR
ncbi:MAG TPA: MarR family transcriptional regulator [Spirochaetia bacterium]|nr:MarR family transcriptional regulator [Spirochaetia bacterium]